MKAITLSIGLSLHDSYELVIRDKLVVVAESDDPGPRGRFDVRVLDFVSVSASRMVNHVLGDCGLRLGLASTGIRVPETQGGDRRGRGCGSLALPVRPVLSGALFFANCSVRAGGTA